ncbi:MAG: DUF4836 family protein [Bacteroidota bacterium]
MKRYSILLVLAAGIILSSCSKKSPEFVNSIPDDVIAVASLHPVHLHTKSKINTFEKIKEKVKGEIWSQILEDPLSTGLMLDEYTYVFVKMEEGAPVIGVVSGMTDVEKFKSTLNKIDESISDGFTEMEGYTYVMPDDEGVIAWNEEQMIALGSPDNDEFEESFWTASLDRMFNPVKEESITSMVDFKDFQGKMKDLNFWLSSDKLMDLVKKIVDKEIPEFPIALYNNYAQVFFDFANGQLNITGETHFSEEVRKNIEEFLVMNPELNEEILKMAPGGNLLLAMAGSMDLEKVQKLIAQIAPPELDEAGEKIEEATGIPPEEFIEAFTGDFTLAVNGLNSENMIPVELFLGFGVKSEIIQEKLLETVGEMVPIEEEGDFFIINLQGTEIYSGIINNNWVLTNAKDYKNAVKGGTLGKSLLDTRFNDYAGGSVGMYMNLDLQSYPDMIQGMLAQNPDQLKWIEHLTGSFDYLGLSASNYKNDFVLKTNKAAENSLYTLLKLTDVPE